MKSLKLRFIIVFMVTLILWLTPLNSLLELVELSKNHFNMITFNSIFAGFNFTTLIALLSLMTTKTIKKDVILGYFDDAIKSIMAGIYISTLAILVSFFNQIFIRDACKIPLFSLEISLSVMSVLSFTFTLAYVRKLLNNEIKSIHEEIEQQKNHRYDTAKCNLNNE